MQTTRLRHGNDHYETIGRRSSTFAKDPKLAQIAALRRWHPDWFDEQGNLVGAVLNVNNNQE